MWKVIDIAHPPLPAEEAVAEMDKALRGLDHTKGAAVLKIIHGYGKSGKGGLLKKETQDWCFRRRKKIRAVIPGEKFSRFDRQTQELLKAYGFDTDPDLERANPGVTIVWVR